VPPERLRGAGLARIQTAARAALLALTVPAHAPRAGYRQALLPDPLGDFPMLAAFIRFLEELIDVANFGNTISK